MMQLSTWRLHCIAYYIELQEGVCRLHANTAPFYRWTFSIYDSPGTSPSEINSNGCIPQSMPRAQALFLPSLQAFPLQMSLTGAEHGVSHSGPNVAKSPPCFVWGDALRSVHLFAVPAGATIKSSSRFKSEGAWTSRALFHRLNSHLGRTGVEGGV